MKDNAENLMFEKEIEYTHGFLDALQLIRSDANPILMRVPKEKQVDALMTAIDDAYTSALEINSENTRIFLLNHWNLESWMEQEGVTPEKYQSEEKHEAEPQSTAPTLNEEKTEKEEKCVLGMFEENGLKIERIMICLPEPIVNYFRAVAIANDQNVGLFERYIEKTVAESLQQRFEDNEGIKKDLNLSKAFKRVLGDEE